MPAFPNCRRRDSRWPANVNFSHPICRPLWTPGVERYMPVNRVIRNSFERFGEGFWGLFERVWSVVMIWRGTWQGW